MSNIIMVYLGMSENNPDKITVPTPEEVRDALGLVVVKQELNGPIEAGPETFGDATESRKRARVSAVLHNMETLTDRQLFIMRDCMPDYSIVANLILEKRAEEAIDNQINNTGELG